MFLPVARWDSSEATTISIWRLSLSADGLSLWSVWFSTFNSHMGEGVLEFTDPGDGDRESKKKIMVLKFLTNPQPLLSVHV